MNLMSAIERLQNMSVDILPSIYDNDITLGTVWNNGFDQCWYLKRMAEIRQYNNRRLGSRMLAIKRKLIATLEKNIIRRYNDQTVYDDTTHRRVEPYQVIVKQDRITNDGLAKCAELITGETSGFFSHYAYGEGTNIPKLSDFKLEFERARVPLATRGYRSASGTVVKHGATFSKTFNTAAITESCVSDMPTDNEDQSILFRVVFPTALQHTINADVIGLAHAMFLSSARDFDAGLEGNQ